jgi:hypothetical protein
VNDANTRENFSVCTKKLPAKAIAVHVQVRQNIFAQSTEIRDVGGAESIKTAESVTGDSRYRSSVAEKFFAERVTQQVACRKFCAPRDTNANVRVRVFVSAAR